MKNIAVLKNYMNVIGGSEKVTANLCNAFVKKYNVFLINYIKGDSCFELNSMVKRICLNEASVFSTRLAYCSIKVLRKALVDNKIEVMIIIGRSALMVPILSSLGMNIKIIYFEQSTLKSLMYNKRYIKGRLKYIYHCLELTLINSFADKIVVLTKKEKNNYINRLNTKVDKLEVIPNYIDVVKRKVCEKKDHYGFKILTVGRLDYAKGYEFLIAVAEKLFSLSEKWQWDIVGGGDNAYRKDLMSRIVENGLENYIRFIGEKDDIEDIYKGYDIFVLTSRYEGFCLALLEAKLRGLPMIAFDIFSGPSDIINDNINGFLIEPYNIESMAQHIKIFIDNREKLNEFSNATKKGNSSFTYKSVVSKWYTVIDEL